MTKIGSGIELTKTSNKNFSAILKFSKTKS